MWSISGKMEWNAKAVWPFRTTPWLTAVSESIRFFGTGDLLSIVSCLSSRQRHCAERVVSLGCWPPQLQAKLGRSVDPLVTTVPGSSRLPKEEATCFRRGPPPLAPRHAFQMSAVRKPLLENGTQRYRHEGGARTRPSVARSFPFNISPPHIIVP